MPEPHAETPFLAVASAQDGSVLRVLHSLPWDHMNVSGTALGPDNSIWVTLNRGPTYTSNVAGGAPAPDSCASEVIKVDPYDGKTVVVLRGNDNELISEATPSPKGRLLAYLQSGCATEYFDWWLTVKDLSTGGSWEIGAGLPRCHVLAFPGWTADSRHLVLTYGQASASFYSGAEGTCSPPDPSMMAVIPATKQARELPSGTITATADAGCEISAAVPTASGYAAMEHCGSLFISGPVRLLRFADSMQEVSSIDLGACEDGADLAVDRSGQDVIGSAYLFCNRPGNQAPLTSVWMFTSTTQGYKHVLSLQGGSLEVSNISW